MTVIGEEQPSDWRIGNDSFLSEEPSRGSGLNQPRLRLQHIADLFKPCAKGIVEQVGVALRGLNPRVAEQLADHRQRHAARNEQGRESMAKVVDANGAQTGLCPDILPKPLDILKRLARGIARKHPLAIFGHAQPDRAKQRDGGSADRRAMQTALLRSGGWLDPDGGVGIELIPARAGHFTAPRAGEQDQAHRIGDAPVRMRIERGRQPPDFIG